MPWGLSVDALWTSARSVVGGSHTRPLRVAFRAAKSPTGPCPTERLFYYTPLCRAARTTRARPAAHQTLGVRAACVLSITHGLSVVRRDRLARRPSRRLQPRCARIQPLNRLPQSSDGRIWLRDRRSGRYRPRSRPIDAASGAVPSHNTRPMRVGAECAGAKGTAELIGSKPDTAQVAAWGGEPAAHRPSPSRQSGRQECRVGRDRVSVDFGVRQHEQRRHRVGPPPPAAWDNYRYDPRLHVQRPHRVLEIHQLSLDLDDQQRSAIRPPGEDVDGATLAEMVERVLDARVPAGADEPLDDSILQSGVPPVEQTGQLRTSPPKRNSEIGLDLFRYSAQRIGRDGPELAPL